MITGSPHFKLEVNPATVDFKHEVNLRGTAMSAPAFYTTPG
jgi:hypothetical protein